MKITDVKPVVGPDRVKPSDPATVSGTASPQDRVSVGSTREAQATVETARRSAGAQRSARLDNLEAQVRSGGYRPDPSRVAEQILSDAEVDARLQALMSRS